MRIYWKRTQMPFPSDPCTVNVPAAFRIYEMKGRWGQGLISSAVTEIGVSASDCAGCTQSTIAEHDRFAVPH